MCHASTHAMRHVTNVACGGETTLSSVTSVAWITACTLSLISASVLGHEIAGPSGASPVVEDIVDKENALKLTMLHTRTVQWDRAVEGHARTVQYLECTERRGKCRQRKETL
jgi:hypothetical protein